LSGRKPAARKQADTTPDNKPATIGENFLVGVGAVAIIVIVIWIF
jgi:hypothetical protein